MVTNECQLADRQVLVRVENGDMYLTSMDRLQIARSEPLGVAVANRLSLRTNDNKDLQVEELWGEPDDDGKMTKYGEILYEHPAGELNPVILKPGSTPKESQEGA